MLWEDCTMIDDGVIICEARHFISRVLGVRSFRTLLTLSSLSSRFYSTTFLYPCLFHRTGIDLKMDVKPKKDASIINAFREIYLRRFETSTACSSVLVP
jgi:molybdenum cofactor biosynthesis enzyme MoaA